MCATWTNSSPRSTMWELSTAAVTIRLTSPRNQLDQFCLSGSQKLIMGKIVSHLLSRQADPLKASTSQTITQSLQPRTKYAVPYLRHNSHRPSTVRREHIVAMALDPIEINYLQWQFINAKSREGSSNATEQEQKSACITKSIGKQLLLNLI